MENTISLLICLLSAFLMMAFLMLAASIRIVREDTRLSVYRLGRYLGERGPGIVLLIPFIDKGELKQLGDAQKTPNRMYVGGVGETLSPVFRDGKVLFSSGEWDAISQTPIASGRRVRVVRMILEIEEE